MVEQPVLAFHFMEQVIHISEIIIGNSDLFLHLTLLTAPR